jgi:YjbE family integral membrane protein
MRFLLNGLSIVLIDLLLAGDNALVIAMAVRSLPAKERRLGIICGAGAAVALRVALTFVAGQLLNVSYVQLAGGLLVIWIAVKVLKDASEPQNETPPARRFAQAIRYIVLADITMSTDNILAIAGASKGDAGLIVFGLALSIPFIVFSSNLLSKLMDRYAWIVYLGAGILGKVGGEMMLTDPFVARTLHPGAAMQYAVQAVLALGLIAAGIWWK